MASCAFEERSAQLPIPLLQHLDKGQKRLRYKNGSTDRFSKMRSCLTFGNFPAYYRARRDFRASCRNEAAITSDFQQLFQDAIESAFHSCCPSRSAEGSSDTGSGASSDETKSTACETTDEKFPVDSSSLYDLDWRLGSLADFDRDIFTGKDVLDLGCNTGRISLIVASLMRARSVLGADVDARLICRARAELRQFQQRYCRPVAEKDRMRRLPRRRCRSCAKDKTNSTAGSDESFAKSRREEGTMPVAVRRPKRKMSSESMASPVDVTHEGSLQWNEEPRSSDWVLQKSWVEGPPSEETPPQQSTCVDSSTTPVTMPECPGHESVLKAEYPCGTSPPNSTGGPDNAKVTPFHSEQVTEVERWGPREVAGREGGNHSISSKTDTRKKLCIDAEAPHFSSGRVVVCSVGGSGDEHEEQRREYPTPHRTSLTYNSRPARSRCEFPYNISFCVADALSGRPWCLPSICRNTCGSGTASESCFCRLTGEIREQQAQASLQTPVTASRLTQTEPCHPGPSQSEYVRTDDDTLCTPLEWETLKQAFDVVICFSLTKWIHLHHGDKGILLLFARLHALLKDGGLLLLEPQDWASYRRARRVCASFKSQLKCIRLSPRMFCSVLTRNRACTCSGELIFCGGELSGGKTGTAGPDETSGTKHGDEGPFKNADLEPLGCPCHGYPFDLLTMLRPWSDLEKSTTQTLVKATAIQASSRCASPLSLHTLRPSSDSGVWRKSVLNSPTRRSDQGRVKMQDESQHPEKCVTRLKGGRFSVPQNQGTLMYQRGIHTSSSGASDVGEGAVNLSPKTLNELANSGLEDGEQELSLRQESVSVGARLLQCRRHYVRKECGCEGHDGDASVRGAALNGPCDALANERSKNHCCETLNNSSVNVEVLQDAPSQLRHSRWKTCQLDAERSRDTKTCTSFAVSHGGRGPIEDEAIHVQVPEEAFNDKCCCELQETCAGEVTKSEKYVSAGFAKKVEERGITQGIHTSLVKRPIKSEGTVGNRFVYVLQKMSSDFTLCCKQLQECAHPKAACTASARVVTSVCGAAYNKQ